MSGSQVDDVIRTIGATVVVIAIVFAAVVWIAL